MRALLFLILLAASTCTAAPSMEQFMPADFRLKLVRIDSLILSGQWNEAIELIRPELEILKSKRHLAFSGLDPDSKTLSIVATRNPDAGGRAHFAFDAEGSPVDIDIDAISKRVQRFEGAPLLRIADPSTIQGITLDGKSFYNFEEVFGRRFGSNKNIPLNKPSALPDHFHYDCGEEVVIISSEGLCVISKNGGIVQYDSEVHAFDRLNTLLYSDSSRSALLFHTRPDQRFLYSTNSHGSKEALLQLRSAECLLALGDSIEFNRSLAESWRILGKNSTRELGRYLDLALKGGLQNEVMHAAGRLRLAHEPVKKSKLGLQPMVSFYNALLETHSPLLPTERGVITWSGRTGSHPDRSLLLLDGETPSAVGVLDLPPAGSTFTYPFAQAETPERLFFACVGEDGLNHGPALQILSVNRKNLDIDPVRIATGLPASVFAPELWSELVMQAIGNEDGSRVAIQISTNQRHRVLLLDAKTLRVIRVDSTGTNPVFGGGRLFLHGHLAKPNQVWFKNKISIFSLDANTGQDLDTMSVSFDTQLRGLIGSYSDKLLVYSGYGALNFLDPLSGRTETIDGPESPYDELLSVSEAKWCYLWHNDGSLIALDLSGSVPIWRALRWTIHLEDVASFIPSDDPDHLPLLLKDGTFVLVERETGNLMGQQMTPFPDAHSLLVEDGVLHGIVEGHYFAWDLDFYNLHVPWAAVGTVTGVLTSGFLLFMAGWNRHKNQKQALALQRAELETELRAAALVQRALQPNGRTVGDGYWALGETRAAWEVGGDFFAVEPIGRDVVLVLLGDVAGHGLQAGVLVATIRGAIAAWQEQAGASVEDLLNTLHKITRNSTVRPRPLICCGALLVDLPRGTAQVWLNGIPRPWVLSGNALPRELDGPCGLPLGAARKVDLRSFTTVLQPGERVLLLSDGIGEQLNPSGQPLDAVRLDAILSYAKKVLPPDSTLAPVNPSAPDAGGRSATLLPGLEESPRSVDRATHSPGGIFNLVDYHAAGCRQEDDRTVLLFGFNGKSGQQTLFSPALQTESIPSQGA
jgi:hypothetical protein